MCKLISKHQADHKHRTECQGHEPDLVFDIIRADDRPDGCTPRCYGHINHIFVIFIREISSVHDLQCLYRLNLFFFFSKIIIKLVKLVYSKTFVNHRIGLLSESLCYSHGLIVYELIVFFTICIKQENDKHEHSRHDDSDGCDLISFAL